MFKQKSINGYGVLLVLGVFLSGSVFAQEQNVSLREEIALKGERQAALYYEVSDNELTTGIGFRVHFNSSNVEVLEIKSYLDLSNVGIQVMKDTDDLDHDPLTDSYINAAWVEMNGEWPSATLLPVKLYSFTFDSISAQASELFKISQSSTPVGYDFVSSIINK